MGDRGGGKEWEEREGEARCLHICHQRDLHHQQKSSVSKATGP